MPTTAFAFRAVALAASALLHVLLYGALSLAPASTPAPRTGLLVTEVVVDEPPAPAIRPPRLVTPPPPRARPQPPKTTETPPPQSTPKREPKLEPAVEREVSEPLPTTPAVDMARQAIDAPSAPTPLSPDGTHRGWESSITTSSHQGPDRAVTALAPAPSAAATSGGPTRTAIPRGGYQVTPSYPATARRLGIQGTTLLGVFVDADGRVADVVVKESAGHPDLDRAATDAVRRWRFEPAHRGAEAIAMWVEVPVQFGLR